MVKKRKKNKSSTSRDFLKLLSALAVLGVLIWIWQHKNPPKVTKPKEAAPPPVAKAEPEKPKVVESPETKSAKTLSGLFPDQTWQDDYLKIPVTFGDDKDGLLVAIGLAPAGKNPDQIRDPDQLRPALMAVKNTGSGFLKEDLFDFSTTLPTEAGIRGSDLRGLPRITPKSLVDLDHDGTHEILVNFDTAGEFAQAIAFLRWQGDKLQWIKTRDKSGKEKIALWLTGATSLESEQVTLQKEKDRFVVIHKKGVLEPKAPQKGFLWTTTVWELKEGVLVEK